MYSRRQKIIKGIRRLKEFIKKAELKNGIIDGGHASGTEIINKYGKEHIKTKKPIIYTSADSVLQIATHEKVFSIKKLNIISNIARKILDEMGINIARIISRPFVDGKQGNFERTKNRRDYSVPPPQKTILDHVLESNGQVISIGKIADIFSNQGITKKISPRLLSNVSAACTAILATVERTKSTQRLHAGWSRSS